MMVQAEAEVEAQVSETWRINRRIKAEAGRLGGGEERPN